MKERLEWDLPECRAIRATCEHLFLASVPTRRAGALRSSQYEEAKEERG